MRRTPRHHLSQPESPARVAIEVRRCTLYCYAENITILGCVLCAVTCLAGPAAGQNTPRADTAQAPPRFVLPKAPPPRYAGGLLAALERVYWAVPGERPDSTIFGSYDHYCSGFAHPDSLYLVGKHAGSPGTLPEMRTFQMQPTGGCSSRRGITSCSAMRRQTRRHSSSATESAALSTTNLRTRCLSSETALLFISSSGQCRKRTGLVCRTPLDYLQGYWCAGNLGSWNPQYGKVRGQVCPERVASLDGRVRRPKRYQLIEQIASAGSHSCGRRNGPQQTPELCLRAE